MDVLDEKRIGDLVEQKLEGRSYSEIREELKHEGFDEDKIREVIRKVDQLVLKEEAEGSRPDRTRQVYNGGLILAVAGLLVSVFFNLGMILQEWPALVVYSPFFLGILAMVVSKRMNRKEKPASARSGAIRRQRPYK